MSAVSLNQSPMPFAVRMAGQAFALAYATRAVMFIALVWIVPSYAIQPPAKVAITRRGSSSSTLSATPTLIDPMELEVPPVAPDKDEVVKLPKKRKSQILSKLSSSVAPVAKHITAPTKRLTASVAMKITPRKMVVKCNSVISGVHTHIPRQLPHLKNAPVLQISPQKVAAVLASCNATMKKLVVPDSVKWHRPRKHATL